MRSTASSSSAATFALSCVSHSEVAIARSMMLISSARRWMYPAFRRLVAYALESSFRSRSHLPSICAVLADGPQRIPLELFRNGSCAY